MQHHIAMIAVVCSRKRIAVSEESMPAAKKSKSADELEDEKRLKVRIFCSLDCCDWLHVIIHF